MAKVELTPYSFMPCVLRSFFINGVDASLEDFGSENDIDPDNAPEYGCGCVVFVPDDSKMDDAMKRYNITAAEFFEIQGQLQAAMSVGCCDICI